MGYCGSQALRASTEFLHYEWASKQGAGGEGSGQDMLHQQHQQGGRLNKHSASELASRAAGIDGNDCAIAPAVSSCDQHCSSGSNAAGLNCMHSDIHQHTQSVARFY